MNPNTVNLLLALISLASQLAPVVLEEVNAIKSQGGKTADEIFTDAGVVIEANNAKALAILADLMTR
jgi:hypothetical protein